MPTFREDLHLGHKVALVETDDISNGAVTTDKIADGAVTLAKLAPEVHDSFQSTLNNLCAALVESGIALSATAIRGENGVYDFIIVKANE